MRAVTGAPDGGGGSRARWWWGVVVVVKGRDGMVTMCDMGDVSTAAAQFGNLQAPINN